MVALIHTSPLAGLLDISKASELEFRQPDDYDESDSLAFDYSIL